MANFHNQTVDFIGMRSETLESPLAKSPGDSAIIEIGSTTCPSLGDRCVKFTVNDRTTGAAIVDSQQIVNGKSRFSLGFAYHALYATAPTDWASLWTIAIQIFYIGFGAPIYGGKMSIIDGLCRAYQEDGHNPRVIEAEDMSDVVARCYPVSNNGNYWITIYFERNATCRMRVTERGTGVLVAEKSWTGVDALPTYLSIGINSFMSSEIDIPQSFYMTDLVVDYTNAVFPLLDYVPTFAVNFDSQGGSSVSSQDVESDGLVSVPSAPTRAGYTFGGWYREAGCTNAWTFASDTVSAATTLYAKWTIIAYAVTFNSLGGSSVTDQSVDYGGHATDPTAPTRAHYTFGGWYTEEACTTAWDFSSGTITAARTLYAKWTAITRTVAFDSQGGSSVASRTVNDGAALGTLPTDPTRAGYTFAGWYSAVSGGTAITASTIVTADMTAYARWTAEDTPVGEGYMTVDDDAASPVAEGSTKTVEVSFFDEAGAAMVPDTVTWSLYTGPRALVGAREDVSATPAATVRIVLSGADHLVSMAQESRRLVIKATYTSTDGAGLPLVAEFGYPVTDITGM
jgi:uncharacterized repeat protein (TIGR02543 family)